MNFIFHEKQEGSLCAQHCLNSLLQGAYFTAVDLSTIAQKLDDEERQRMAECGEESEEYRKFLSQPSGNMDDSGYFSVQVISCALEVWGLELVPFSSTDSRVQNALAEPSNMNAFICNYRDHWLTVRKIGNQWFNLNSLLSKPELISDTYLSLYLAQLKNEGYSIFVVLGKLPECSADEIIGQNPVVPVLSNAQSNTSSRNENDVDLQRALKMSLDYEEPAKAYLEPNVEDSELQEALRLSLQLENGSCEDEDEESLLRKAIDMSLQS